MMMIPLMNFFSMVILFIEYIVVVLLIYSRSIIDIYNMSDAIGSGDEASVFIGNVSSTYTVDQLKRFMEDKGAVVNRV